MPAAAGALFLPLLLLSVLAEYGIGIGLLVTAYVFATTRGP